MDKSSDLTSCYGVRLVAPQPQGKESIFGSTYCWGGLQIAVSDSSRFGLMAHVVTVFGGSRLENIERQLIGDSSMR